MVDELLPEEIPPVPRQIIRRDLFREPAFQKVLVQDPFVEKARERIWAMLHATTVLSVKEERADRYASDAQLDEMFGRGQWVSHRGRILFRVDNTDAQIAAAREVLSRAEPQLNRADPGSTRTFKVFRINPNEEDGEAIGLRVEEVEDGEIVEIGPEPVVGDDPEPTEVGEMPRDPE